MEIIIKRITLNIFEKYKNYIEQRINKTILNHFYSINTIKPTYYTLKYSEGYCKIETQKWFS